MTNALRLTQKIKNDRTIYSVDRFADALWITTNSQTSLSEFEHYREEYKYAFLSDRSQDTKSKPKQIWGDKITEIIVSENDHKFLIKLQDHFDPGLFLDHSPARKLIGEISAGKRFLNLFAYTGSFTVYAEQALQTTTVDLSNQYCLWALENFKINGMMDTNYYKYLNNYQKFTKSDNFKHRVVKSAVTDFLDLAIDNELIFDLIVIDPPSYSHSGAGKFNVQTDHKITLSKALRLLSPTGQIFFSTNLSDFTLAEVSGADVVEITGQTIPESFKPSIPHRAFSIKKT